MPRRNKLLSLATLFILVGPGGAAAERAPSVVCASPGNQLSPTIATDGHGGAILAWLDSRDSTVNVFSRRILASGAPDPAWPATGRALRAAPSALAGEPESPAFPVIVSDGAGGAIVAWQDGRSVESQTDLYAQHVLKSGALDRAWPLNGAPLCVAAGLQHAIAMVPDGAGGAIAAWMDERGGPGRSDLYAQHLLASGAPDPRWPRNGLVLCASAGPQEFPVLVGDGAGGAIVAWYDLRTVAMGFDVYAQHVLGSGQVDPAWPAGGRVVCGAEGDQVDVSIAPDGAHGAIVVWDDNRRGAFHPFAQHVLASGTVDPAWPWGGRAISNQGAAEEFPQVVPDGTGGGIVTWQTRAFRVSMFAQHLEPSGVVDPSWPVGGRPLSVSSAEETSASIAPDGAGGAIVVWESAGDLVGHVLASGALDPAYPETGLALSDSHGEQGLPAIVATGAGKAIVTWPEAGGGAETDLYAAPVSAGAHEAPGSTQGGNGLSRPSATGVKTLK
jgi:hypothetical protein